MNKTETENASPPTCNVRKLTMDSVGSAKMENVRKVTLEAFRPRSASTQENQHLTTSDSGKRTIIDYRLAPEVHDHIVQHTWEMNRVSLR